MESSKILITVSDLELEAIYVALDYSINVRDIFKNQSEEFKLASLTALDKISDQMDENQLFAED